MIYVYCGQKLDSDVMKDTIVPKVNALFTYPEGDLGYDDLMILVRDHSTIDTIYITRYGMVLNALGGMINDRVINTNDVIVNLYNNGEWSEHRFDEDGYMGKDWPFGVLGY